MVERAHGSTRCAKVHVRCDYVISESIGVCTWACVHACVGLSVSAQNDQKQTYVCVFFKNGVNGFGVKDNEMKTQWRELKGRRSKAMK